MGRLVLLRHAQSEWNADGRWQGWADPPLTPLGEAQALATGRHLAATELGAALGGPTISSDLRRAVQTAEILAVGLKLPGPGDVDPQLREIDVGAWSGLRRDEIARLWPGWLNRWDSGHSTSTPGGESRTAFDTRVREACRRWLADDDEGTRLMVTHGGVIRSLTRLLGLPSPGVPNLGGALLEAAAPSGPGRPAWTMTPLPGGPRPEGSATVRERRAAPDQPLPCRR